MGCLKSKPQQPSRRECPQGHVLKYVRPGQNIRECSTCRKPIRAEQFLTCEECNFNQCPFCHGQT